MKSIQVTQDDISYDMQNNIYGCAIALAVKRQINAESVMVSNLPNFLVDGSWYTMPKKGLKFIKRFDTDKKLAEPFSFALRRRDPKKVVLFN